MVNIKDIIVIDQFSTEFLYIQFSIEDTDEDLSNYSFNLHRSNNAQSGYVNIASDIKNNYYVDKVVNLYNPLIEYCYKIEVINKNTGKSELTDFYGQYKGKKPDQYAATIIHMNETYIQNVVENDTLYLLGRKHDGQKCSCYDDVRGRSSIPSSCHLCYGTKYSGGYYSVEKFQACFLNAAGKSERFTLVDQTQEETPLQFWTSNFPVIHINDIIVDRNNTRYIVMNVQPSYKNYYMLKQVVQMQRLPKSNIAYKIPINI